MDNIFASVAQRKLQLQDELAAQPVVEITGVVGASGLGAGKSRGDELWSLLLVFDAWRVGNGPVRTDPITLRRKVSDEELRVFQSKINPETVVRICARISEENVFGSPQGFMEEFLRVDTADAELQEYLAALRKPTTHEDEFFGMFSFDRRTSLYTANVLWDGEGVTLRLFVNEPTDFYPALKVAHTLWSDYNTWDELIRNRAFHELILLKNGEQPVDGEIPAAQVKPRLILETILVYPDGSFDFSYDGDLAKGHLLISGNITNGITNAGIAG